ncbi:hypothetical protein [Marivita hallyeonensis]|uniref:Uncharacterized protein n=1 Tax=Marivita hallyeonensis TaxID=996342 RepID=A0A1M5VJ58_9RHOB|nr:hypothetical protein [Marivita hallyeonensis]SHH75230.1 hypothetical protein SAMN05443551_2899 [Marivita hallyeonensis]
MRIKAALIWFLAGAIPVAAQDGPLSAIDWLAVQREIPSVVAITPAPNEAPVAETAAVPDIEVQTLNAPSVGGTGLLPSSITGLPPSLWRGSTEADVIAALEPLRRGKPAVPALDTLLHTLLLAEADPPQASDGKRLFEARIDALYDHGLVAPAEAMVDRAGDLTPTLFQRAFDLALLTGSDEALCQRLNENPSLSRDLSTRIWCATRAGDFSLAMTVYQTGVTLAQLSDTDEELLLRFLDPEYAEQVDPLRPPVRPTPLQFRLFEAIGEALPTAPLPLPFAVVELTGDAGWRAQLQAAERLARAGAIDGNQLLGAYTQQMRAASGGIWDRVEALQRFETALTTGDPGAVSSSLERVWPQMRNAGLLVPFANLFASRLQGLPLSSRAARIAAYAALLSDDYEALAGNLADTDDPQIAFLAAIAKGQAPQTLPPDMPHRRSLADTWQAAPVAPPDMARMPGQNRLGEALLRTIDTFENGANGNSADLTSALTTLRAFGLEDTARRSALQLAILDLERARR